MVSDFLRVCTIRDMRCRSDKHSDLGPDSTTACLVNVEGLIIQALILSVRICGSGRTDHGQV